MRGTHRALTIVLSDLHRFLQAVDQLEPKDLSQLLNEYLSEMIRLAGDHQVPIQQIPGRGMLIPFAALTARQAREMPVRAVELALEMQGLMALLQQRWRRAGLSAPWQLQIGIHTGLEAPKTGNVTGLATGPLSRTATLAAQVQTHCEPGRVLITSSTWSLVKDRIRCVEQGELTVEGARRPFKVYEVVGGTGDGS